MVATTRAQNQVFHGIFQQHIVYNQIKSKYRNAFKMPKHM